MPVGLADTLTRDELVNLVRFLSELGKVGPYATSQARVARRWQVLQSPTSAAAGSELDLSALDGPTAAWTSVYSLVSGDLPLDGLNITPVGDASVRLLRCQVDVAAGGRVALIVPGPISRAWLDGKPIELHSNLPVDLAVGLHTITLAVPQNSRDTLRLELADVPGSGAQVQMVGGK